MAKNAPPKTIQSVVLKAAPVSEAIYRRVKTDANAFRKANNRAVTLATILVGEDNASQIYVRKKGEMCLDLGLGHKDFKLKASTNTKELLKLIDTLNVDDSIDGILVQKPLPKNIDTNAVIHSIAPAKDVDCFSPENVGLLTQGLAKLLPCTPSGIFEILEHYRISVSGKNVLIIGRSDIVGKPAALLALQKNATVTIAHSKTHNLKEHIAIADIVISAVGKADFLDGNMPWKKSAVVIDVGMNRNSSGKLTGDVNFESVAKNVSAITPVPGGVGPMTIAMLMVNTVRAAMERAKK